MCGNYAILGGKSGRSLVRPVAMGLLVGEIVPRFCRFIR